MPVRLPVRTSVAALASIVLAIVLTPAILVAHARLVRSSPAAGAKTDAAPTALTFWFSERPEVRFTTIRLFDSSGVAVALGEPTVLGSGGGDAMALTIPIVGALHAGRYKVSWRTAAADGHATAGTFPFTIAAAVPATAPPTPRAEAAKSAAVSDSGQATNTSNAVVEAGGATTMSDGLRWAELVAVVTLAGVVMFGIFVLPGSGVSPEVARDAADRARRFGNALAILFLVTTAWRAVAESDLMPGAETGEGRLGTLASMVRLTSWGRGWLVGIAGLILMLAGFAVARRRPGRAAWIASGLGAVAICFSESLTGHAASSSHVPVAIASDLAHLLAAGGWLGGLAVLLMCGLPATRRAEEAVRPLAGQTLVRAYHGAAVQCVALVLITAVLSAWLRLPSLDDLWSTSYGWLLLGKIGLAIVAMGFGAYHWRRVVTTDWAADTGSRFRRTGIGELVAGALVLAVTAVLVSTALPTG